MGVVFTMPKKPAAPAATTASKKAVKKDENSLFQRTPKNFGVGNNVQPKKDLSRMVKMPKNVRMQRQRRILYQRLKVPPAISQFTKTVDKNSATDIFKMLNKYRPESKEQKDERRKATAEKGAAPAKSKTRVSSAASTRLLASLSRRRPPWSSLLTTLIPSSSLCGFLPCAARWTCPIALSRARPVLDRWFSRRPPLLWLSPA